MIIDAKDLDFKELNQKIRDGGPDILIKDCLGQRFIAAGTDGKHIQIKGIPGNALGAYLNGSEIEVLGNAQDAVGDTMNAGKIIIHGNIGDAAGYAMRGGEIYVKGNAGYRAGIHMKEYKNESTVKMPVMVIGGGAGSFLGEYQAGGIIAVLGLELKPGKDIVSNFPCTGMHGGKMVLRGDVKDVDFPKQTNRRIATEEDMFEIRPFIEKYCDFFRADANGLLGCTYTVITPDSKNPYKQMYVAN